MLLILNGVTRLSIYASYTSSNVITGELDLSTKEKKRKACGKKWEEMGRKMRKCIEEGKRFGKASQDFLVFQLSTMMMNVKDRIMGWLQHFMFTLI